MGMIWGGKGGVWDGKREIGWTWDGTMGYGMGREGVGGVEWNGVAYVKEALTPLKSSKDMQKTTGFHGIGWDVGWDAGLGGGA